MKTTNEIVSELNNISFIKDTVDKDSPHVRDVITFYEKYPQYNEVPANGVFFILLSVRTKNKPVKVYQFDNGSIWFVGDIITASDAPIASIGGLTLSPGTSWEEGLKSHAKIIDTITWNF